MKKRHFGNDETQSPKQTNHEGQSLYNKNHKKKLKCYICGENHKVFECSRRFKENATMVKEDAFETEYSMVHTVKVDEKN